MLYVFLVVGGLILFCWLRRRPAVPIAEESSTGKEEPESDYYFNPEATYQGHSSCHCPCCCSNRRDTRVGDYCGY